MKGKAAHDNVMPPSETIANASPCSLRFDLTMAAYHRPVAELTPPEHPRQAAFDRFSKAVDGPLTILALAMIPLLVIPLVVELSPAVDRGLLAADYLIWAIFAIEYVAKVYLAPDRGRYVRRHVPDLIIVLIPFLRPLRVLRSMRSLRLMRLVRVGAFATRGLGNVRAILRSHGLNYVLLIVTAVVVVAAGLVYEFERNGADTNIRSFPDALWWAATTVTTVGYGDHFPVSAAGRGVAVALMVTGIALFGVLTASIAAFFVEKDTQDEVNQNLRELNARLASIEKLLSAGGPARSADR